VIVADAIAKTLAAAGTKVAFGLVGSGNLVLTNALTDARIRFYAARHESNAMAMADGFARATGFAGVVTLHQGPGFTNVLTHLTEAAKSRSPVLVLAADTPPATLWSNFKIDQSALARETGAVSDRVRSPATAGEDTRRALERMRDERRPVVLSVPIDLVQQPGAQAMSELGPTPYAPAPSPAAIAALVDLIDGASRPVILAGRGAVRAGAGLSLRALSERIGAVLATSGGAHGLFADAPTSVGIAGGFSSPLAAELLGQADLVMAFGASLNHWTTDRGRLLHPDVRVVQVDLDAEALGALRHIEVGVVADADAAARALVGEVERRRLAPSGFDLPAVANAVTERTWRDEPFTDEGTEDTIDPRTLTIALDELLPASRAIATDGGHFLGYPSMYLAVPDAAGFIFPQAFQGIGQGLGAAIGAAVGRRDRLTVAALGDGGALMALSDLETVGRYRLPMLIVIYNDAAYGAEVHHFESLGHAVDHVRFPSTDFAALARAVGVSGATIRQPADLARVSDWLGHRDGPLLIDAKVNPTVCAEWLPAAFADG
jgi:acetolactate synthase I/II/III large subunit